ncbi:MAG: DNA polymerase III subunit delta [Lachnospiraceae bacterium]|jgi:DNA polymerase-3 subunit delta
MQTLNNHIKSGAYSDFYLLYGEEDYLIRYYRDRLSEGILNDSPSGNMNYRYYNSDTADDNDIAEQAKLVPFFADNFLIVVEDSGFMKKANSLSEKLTDKAESTKIIFVEHDVDKRNSLYKFVKAHGTICEFKHYRDDELISWIAAYLGKSGCRITPRGAKHLIEKSGTKMQQLINEMDKLISYVGDKAQIDTDDVDAICTTLLSSRIFNMMDFIVSGKRNDALKLYADLLAMKESPLSILFLLTRHYNILAMIKELYNQSDAAIAKIISVPSFSVRKYKAQANAYKKEELINIITECVDVEEKIKTGKLVPQVGVELLIIRLSGLTP